ncbi:MAG: M48 family metallopeptidase [Christensenellaceae bacterium]
MYQLKRGFRKSILLRVTKDAAVEVLAPFSMKKKEIDAFVLKKREWLLAQLEIAEAKKEAREQYALAEVIFLGEAYPVRLYDGAKIKFENNAFLLPRGSVEERRKKMITWYKKQAKEILSERVAFWAEKMQTTYAAVKVTSAKTRWGSCTSQQNLNFSWRVMFAPPDAIDYVVIHELAHTKEMSHSKVFWGIVETYCKEYKAMQAKLKETGAALDRQGWE